VRLAADEEARAVGGQAETEHSKRHPEHKVYHLLRGKTIDQPNQVWAAGRRLPTSFTAPRNKKG
jgi:hypothetical protein